MDFALKINSRGFWENDTTEGHGHDENLAKGIVNFLNREFPSIESSIYIADIGCGDGYYTKYLIDSKFNCDGYDGNPNTPKITNGLCYVQDFSKPLSIVESGYDVILCLEVGEHVPKEFEQIFLDNLALFNSQIIILSWAIPNQAGDGHVNCQPNSYIISEMAKRGYELNVMSSDILRGSASKYPNVGYWFKNTLMVFIRE